MKKIMFAAAMIAATAAVADVTSANTVGYANSSTVVAVNRNFVMVAPNFLNIADSSLSSKSITCDQLTTSYDLVANDFFSGWTDDAACLQVPDGVGGYIMRYYIDDAEDTVNGGFVTGWASDGGTLANVDIDLGTGVWVRGKQNTVTTFTFAGAVSDNASETVSRATPIRFELVANPYPTALDINSSKISWTLAAVTSYDEVANDFFAGWTDDAACLQVPDGVGGYYMRYYIDDAEDTVNGGFVTGWASDGGTLSTAVVPAGSGFWLRRCSQDGKTQAWSFTTSL